MKCSRCQHENPSALKFCGECGAQLTAVCASCGAANSPEQKFCGECGTKLSSDTAGVRLPSPESYTPKHLAERILTSRSALEGERKQVTVLFADLKGSIELLADRDPEEARKILDPVLERMMEAVHHYEGTVNQIMGDGIMALFGAPLAHEDHAVRACYAALRMQRAIQRYSEEVRRSAGVPVSIRVGLNSGEVVVRSIGEIELAADKASAAVAIGDAHGWAGWPPRSAVIAGAALVEQGRVNEGLAAIQEAVNRVAGVGLKSWIEVFSATVLAWAYGKAGHPEKGLEALETLPTLTGIGFYEPEVRRVRGELLLAQSPHAAAEAQACFRAALEQALARQERSLALRAAMSLASLLQRNGERESARTVLAPVYASFDEGLDTADLRRARALLEELA